MGKSMCGHLIKNGYQLSVYNRTRSKADELVKMGATYYETPRELASQVDYLVLMLGYPKDVEDMIYHPDKGIIDVMKPNSYLIDHTTSAPALAVRIAEDMKVKNNIMVLDGPVSGGDVGAKAGQVVTMIGGQADAIDHCMPLLDCYSKKVMNMGLAG